MRTTLLSILECPSCGGGPISIADPVEADTEIRSATLRCAVCGSIYPVEKGIATLLPDVADSIVTEIDAWSGKIDLESFDEKMHETYRRMMLSLPAITEEFEPDSDARDLWCEIGDNFDRFALRNSRPGMTVLDVGAGRCWSSAALARRGASVVALDTLTKLYIGLETADVYIEETGVFFERVRGDMHRLPFASGSFDLVAESESAHHAADTLAFFNEVRRVLKPGGRFALASEYLSWEGDEPLPGSSEGITERQIGIAEWFGLFRSAGLVPVRCKVQNGRSFCCLLARRGDRPPVAEAATAMLCSVSAEANYRWWRFVSLAKAGALAPEARATVRDALVRLGLPTSPRALVPGAGYLSARFSRGSPPPPSISPWIGAESTWLGRGWYPLAPGKAAPARRAHRRADLVLTVPAGVSVLGVELGLGDTYPFARPASATLRMDGTALGTLDLKEGLQTHRFSFDPASADRIVSVSLEVERDGSAPSSGRPAQLGMVVGRVEAGGA
ncbi:MAG TPA: methyltransferase domain-containing protein [Candidatus Anoxymicrobiaceae bacterium]